MNVPQRHCVPLSFCPDGPIGLENNVSAIVHCKGRRVAATYRAHIQNCLPQLTPGFFVVKLVQGSLWPSQRGEGFFEKSFTQDSLVACGSMKASVSNEEGEEAVARLSAAVGLLPRTSASDADPGGVLAVLLAGSVVAFGAKKPFSERWPLASPDCALETTALDFAFFDGLEVDIPEARRFSGEFKGLGDIAGLRLWLLAMVAAPEGEVAFFLNMSLIVRRLSNSGRSLPDSGRMSFVGLKSLSLTPSLNMPVGFIISAMWVSFPRQSTTAFVDAYTGQWSEPMSPSWILASANHDFISMLQRTKSMREPKLPGRALIFCSQ